MQSMSDEELRASLRDNIAAARDSFRRLTEGLGDEAWRGRSEGSRWTGKQLLHHVTWAVEQLPREVESAARGRGMFNYPKFLADPCSYWLVKWEARPATRESLLVRYDSAVERVLETLEQVSGGWDRGARFYGEGFYSISDLFRTPSTHLLEHTAALTR